MLTAASRARRMQAALGLCLVAAAGLAGAQERGDGAAVEAGRRIYEEGVLASGAPLSGTHANGVAVSGAQAACVRCHRRSGMGAVEGDIQAPPITGNALFGARGGVVATMDPRSGKLFNFAHEPYTEASLARALREGASGHGDLNGLMPRFALRDVDMKALIAYLRQLSVDWSPGASAREIRFATVIAPGVAPDLRRAFVDTVEKAVQQKNGSTVVAAHGGNRRHMAGAAEFVLGTERKWAVDVWELQGSPDTWAAQLDALYRRTPVFALVSGLGRGDWEPVSAFCERNRVPCWFPSIDLAPDAPADYAIYFSRGVALEAEVLAEYLKTLGDAQPRRVVQIYRDDGTGPAAARALRWALAGTRARVDDRKLSGDPEALRRALRELGPRDAAVLWLRAPDLGALDTIAPPPGAQIFLSARMGDEGRSLPPAWKSGAEMIYPYELPAKRQANLAYFRAWLAQRGIPLVDEAVQSEAYFALAFLTDTMTEMLDNLYRDYLLERAENMISRREGARAEEEMRSASQARILRTATRSSAIDESAIHQAGSLAGREGTSVYPRLSLAPGQRFASKGACIVRFESDGKLVAVGDWVAPAPTGGNSVLSQGRR